MYGVTGSIVSVFAWFAVTADSRHLFSLSFLFWFTGQKFRKSMVGANDLYKEVRWVVFGYVMIWRWLL